MALLFIDSFDHYATPDIGIKWSASNNGAVGAATINSTGGRRSGGALSLKWDATVRKDFPATSTIIVGMAVRVGLFGTTFGINGGIMFLGIEGVTGTHMWITCNPDGSISAWRRTGQSSSAIPPLGTSTAAVLQPNVYAYVEVKATIHPTDGRVRVLVNGQSVLNLIGINTMSFDTTTALASKITLSNANSNTVNGASITLFDDFYLADDTGTVNNDFFGDCRIDMVLPNADGTYKDFTPDTGTAHFSRVNEAVADSLSNVASSTVGAKDSFRFPALTSIVGTVRGVQVVDAALKDDAGVRSIGHLARSGSSEQYTTGVPLSTDRKLYTSIFETDPATGTNWTQTSINAAEFGVVVTA